MRYLLWKIRKLKEKDLQILMHAFEKRYAEAYSEWEVCYFALHRDPKQRQQDLAPLLLLLHQRYETE